MSWPKVTVRFIIGLVFLSVPAIAWAVLWPAAPDQHASPEVACARLPLPMIVAAANEQATEGPLRNRPVELLNAGATLRPIGRAARRCEAGRIRHPWATRYSPRPAAKKVDVRLPKEMTEFATGRARGDERADRTPTSRACCCA